MWAEQIGKALPPAQYPPKDLPKDHPLFRSIFDIGDSWEEEASNPQYFYEFSTKGYAFGIDAIVYSMTH